MSLLSCARKASVVMEWEEKPITAKCGESKSVFGQITQRGNQLALRQVATSSEKSPSRRGLALLPLLVETFRHIRPIWHFISCPRPIHLAAADFSQVPAKLKIASRTEASPQKSSSPARDKALERAMP